MTRHRHRSGPLPSCFRPTTPDDVDDDSNTPPSPSPPPPPSTATPNLTTSIYHTRLGIFALTWSRTLLGRSLRLHLFPNNNNNQHNRSLSFPTPRSLPSSPSTSSSSSSSSSPSFHLTLKPFVFWNKQGSKKLPTNPPATIFWDFTRAKFESASPEPESGFYIAVLSPDGSLALLLGDSDQKAHLKTKPKIPFPLPHNHRSEPHQSLVVRREHVQGATKLHRTKVHLGGKPRAITIECDVEENPDPKLMIRVDSKVGVEVKHLKWKFRGSERIEVDGYPIQISWDVHNWLFTDLESGGGGGGNSTKSEQEKGSFGLFTFRFEKRRGSDRDCSGGGVAAKAEEDDAAVFWSEELSGSEEKRMMSGRSHKKRNKSRSGLVGGMRKTRSSSSSSVTSSASSSACGSVLEWESVEETELKGGDGPTAFSLLVYAWKS